MSKFVITDVFGNTVVGSFSAWEHVLEGHPEMDDKEELVKAAIQSPMSVYETSSNARLMFRGVTIQAGFWSQSFVKALVNYARNNVGFLVTAYLDTLEPKGTKRWP